MNNFLEEYITICNQGIITLINENGVRWYPMNSFFKKILFKNFNIQYYRDSTFVKNMQVIQYKFKEQKGLEPIKTWFVNEKGVKLILKNMNVAQDNKPKTKVREQKLYEACTYFGIQREENLTPRFISIHPDITSYDAWSKLCIENDKTISQYSIWKRCEKCDKYYPDTNTYFEKIKDRHGKDRLKRTCKKCTGKNFVNNDVKIQKDFQYGGSELVVYLQKKQYTRALKYLVKNNIKYTPSEFYQKDVAILLTGYIKKNIIHSRENYNVSYISKILGIPPTTLRDLLKDNIKIGYLKAMEIKRKPRKVLMTESKLIAICHKRFAITIPKSKINIPNIEPIIGIINQGGLFVICKNPQNIRHAKLYKFTSDMSGIESILRTIERTEINEG